MEVQTEKLLQDQKSLRESLIKCSGSNETASCGS